MWVQSCISKPRLSALVNGSPTEEFLLERGLRQGHPLSYFLFNMVVEILSCCLKKPFELNKLRSVVVGNNKVHVSHLQFTDDKILFIEQQVEFLANTKRILRCFEMASGLKTNFYKSDMVKVGKNGMEKRKMHVVDWRTVCKSKRYEGLAIERIKDNNIGLLMKWVWKFGREEGKIISEGFNMVVGRGSQVKFWEDVWNGVMALMRVFPRIYALADKIEGSSHEFGRWIEDVWIWEVHLRRRIFYWEVEQWKASGWFGGLNTTGEGLWSRLRVENLETVCIDVKPPNRNKAMTWSPPSVDALKFNVDGAANGKRSRAGIGGALCNFKRDVMCSFSIFVGAQDAIKIEMMANHKACSFCVAQGSFVGKKIDFVSDSREVVNWLNEEGFGNLNLVNLIYDIQQMIDSLEVWRRVMAEWGVTWCENNSLVEWGHWLAWYVTTFQASFNSRANNCAADLLAKKGVSRKRDAFS
ncbi:hypothetical protein Ddye_001070 [Dipteronia dyeriana]|uniref:Reverse transcriptase domain-containing protein n=1 Tax=Dipteronia dyeriana TaxID=168575 RepID=A0AAD9XNE3_9ROSI|nr:hypothetical protein Ddye_001070 [Dipteronia dyeriana]